MDLHVVTRDVRDQKNYTSPGPEPRPKEKLYRDHDRDQRLNPMLYDGLNSVNFCTSEVTLFEKKEPKSASCRLKKLKKRVLKNFLDEILNYRSAGPLSGPGLGPGLNKKSYQDLERDQKKLVPRISRRYSFI